MVKNHLKRLAIPRTWRIGKKKGIKFITRPNAGKLLLYSMPVNIVLKEQLGLVKTTKETKYLLKNKEVMVNGNRINDHRYPLGLMDTLDIKELENSYRLVLDKKGKLALTAIDKSEALLKPVKIVGKTLVKKGKVQLNCGDGTNLITEKNDYAMGDVLVLKLPKKEVQSHIKLEKGVTIYLIGGKNSGNVALVEDIKGNKVFFKIGEEKFETLKEYAFAIGKEKPVVKVE